MQKYKQFNTPLDNSSRVIQMHKGLIKKIIEDIRNELAFDHYKALRENSIGHGFFHSFEVLKIALEIAKEFKRAEEVNFDYEVIIAGAILHDISYVAAEENVRFTSISKAIGQGENHHIDSAKIAGKILEQSGMSREKIEKTQHAIKSHRGKGREPEAQTPEAKIISDADTFVGATSIKTHIAIVNQLKDKIAFFDPTVSTPERIESLKVKQKKKKKSDMFMIRLNSFILDRDPDKYYTKCAQKLISCANSTDKIKSDFRKIVDSRKDLNEETKKKIYFEFDKIIQEIKILPEFRYLTDCGTKNATDSA